MELLLLLVIFFTTCGLLNKYMFASSPSKIFGSLCALLSPASTRTKPVAKDHDTRNHDKDLAHEEDEEEEEEANKKASSTAAVDLSMAFSTFDHDGDGFITTSELVESFKRLGIVVSAAEAMSMVERVDANRDGLIDIEEFRELYDSIPASRDKTEGSGEVQAEREEGGEEKDLREAFDVFDGNGDGLISAEELGAVLGSLGLRGHGGKAAADCRDMIRSVDIDGDGMVNFEEFKRMMVVKS